MTKFTAEQKQQIKNQLINELSESQTLDIIGGRLGTKKWEILVTARLLVEQGLAVKSKTLYGGIQITITENGKQYAVENKPVIKISSAQKERQQTRINGKYSEMIQCDVCLKRFSSDSVYYDEDLGGCICDKCLTKKNK